VFRALGLGTKKRYVVDSAVPAALAFKQKALGRIFEQLNQMPSDNPAVDSASKHMKQRSYPSVEIEEPIMACFENLEVSPVKKRNSRTGRTHR